MKNKKDNKKEEIVKRKDEPDVINVSTEDEKMNQAIEKAKLTLKYFEQSLKNPKPEQQYFSLKVKIVDGNEIEHIWLIEPSFDDQGIAYGKIGNNPVYVSSVKLNQKIGIDRGNISDWMIIENGRLIGGYTIRAIRAKYSGKDLENFDKSTGLYIDEGVDYFEHDFETPEGAILCLEDAYNEKNIEKAILCKDFKKEAENMLSKMKHLKIDAELIEKTSEVLELSFIKSIEEKGFPSFDNILRSFEREKISDHEYIIIETCIYPDHSKGINKLLTIKGIHGWRVVGLVD